jgi:hypothetical protein
MDTRSDGTGLSRPVSGVLFFRLKTKNNPPVVYFGGNRKFLEYMAYNRGGYVS